MKDTKTPEPEFFLKNELIYFLKKHADITVTETRQQGEGVVEQDLITQFSIDKQLICATKTRVPQRADAKELYLLKAELSKAKADIASLIHHLLEQQKRLDALEGKPAQQYVAVPK